MTSGTLLTNLLANNECDLIALHYTGFFSQHNITAMGEVIRCYLENNEASFTTRRKLFSTFIEMVQNILRYSSDTRALLKQDDEMRFGSVSFGVHAGKYVFESANLVAAQEMARLRHSLESIRRMSAEEIKQTYKASLRAETPVWSKGANMGFLTLARDASEPLQFAIHPVESSDLSAFYLKAVI
ncbi:hypothetical protein BL250_16230 [Erwinia sp. OLTSP20]|uniref:SiaB family protein kinase n=1 Tax=unclassified Erwinia TaxID=2622719 RepID=UPI000C46F220|nr:MULTISPECIES: SiaB family protein kinase [unclassified Erwinia]PIJ49066.1 hypothetical protein BV501_14305 [Erwinia sp. OAMSP11]PIJ74646.1 hypothetical protein BK416_03510 [Erwinia sp. OLSSP12]PIJ79750.1 hypothetical protein BLD47_12930 [Erwinia sp. OLCASP19]PIJ80535.1 hypothetical protein BLD46_14775 [Erwinia sp. OLMTSP26]PIJ82649.1 hypothetical protein BLD49_14670 [Erwinia sp. OLMDSP33]